MSYFNTNQQDYVKSLNKDVYNYNTNNESQQSLKIPYTQYNYRQQYNQQQYNQQHYNPQQYNQQQYNQQQYNPQHYNQQYNQQQYDNRQYDNQQYDNQQYDNQQYNNQQYDNQQNDNHFDYQPMCQQDYFNKIPLEIKSVDSKPLEIKSLEPKPLEIKSLEPKPLEIKSLEPKPLDIKQMETNNINKLGTPIPGSPGIIKIEKDILLENNNVIYNKKIINNNMIDDELNRFEYVLINKIIKKGENVIKYITAINKNGQKVLVDIDDKNTDKKSKTNNNIPENIKINSMNCINNIVCGVAFDCENNEMSVLNKDNTELKPKEYTFECKKIYNSDKNYQEDIIVYPIVKMSEIRVNSKDLLINIDIATSRLQNMTYNNQVENLGMTHMELNKLNNNFNNFNLIREDITHKLKNTLKKLKEINLQYKNDQVLIESNKDSYKQLQKNLQLRENNMMKLSNYIKIISNNKNKLEEINKNIEGIIENCNKEFENIDLTI